jgi:hypothetical protein
MPFHFHAASNYRVTFAAKLLGLLGKLLRRFVHLERGLVDGGLAGIEAGFALGQGSLHLRDLALPLDQLLAECGDSQAMFSPGAVEQLLLAAETLGLFADLKADSFQVLAVDARVVVQFAKMTAEHVARG